jgi:uncharacterized protein YciI
MRNLAAAFTIAWSLALVADARAGDAAAPVATPSPHETPTAPPPSLFVVHFSAGPAWVADQPFPEQAGAKDHSANLKRLRDTGALVIGARYADQGMIVVKAASEEEARAEIAKDPMVASGTFAMTIAEFLPFYSGCVP